MHKNFFYLLSDFTAQPTVEIGVYARALGKLLEHELIAPKAVCIPKNTLKIIAQANNLQPKIYSIVSDINFQNTASRQNAALKIRQLIEAQRVPKNLAEAFLDIYLHYLEESHVLVTNAHQMAKNIEADSVYPEAVLMDSILETWGQLTQDTLHSAVKKTEHIHDILFPSALLLVQQRQAEVSGIAYSFDIRTGAKNRYTVRSTWGVFAPTQQADTFFLDANTDQTIFADIGHKQTYLQRLGGMRTTFHTSSEQQKNPSLTPKQLAQIAQAVRVLKRLHLEHIKVEWSIQQDGSLTINNYTPTEPTALNEQPSTTTQLKHTAKKLYVSIHNKQELSAVQDISDGICVYNSGQLLSITGSHPLHLVKTKQKKYVVAAISRVLGQYIEQRPLPLLYRSNQLTSAELGKLEHAAQYEPSEANPYLGLRGAQKLIEQPQLLELELAIMQELSNQTTQPLGYVLSFVRSSEECKHLVQRISRSGLTNKKTQLWLELNTPANILNISQYPLHEFSGIIINSNTINTLLTGADGHNSSVAGRYSVDTDLLEKLVHTLLAELRQFFKHTNIHSKPQIMLDLTNFNHQLFDRLQSEELDGYILNSDSVEFAREQLLLAQKDQLFKHTPTRIS